MKFDSRLRKLEQRYRDKTDPLQVVLVWFGDGELPRPLIAGGVHIKYVRFEGEANEV
jgi:hypothetical protein